MEVEQPVFEFDAEREIESLLVGGELVVTTPENYYPTRWCRDDKRVRPKTTSHKRSASSSSLQVICSKTRCMGAHFALFP